VDTTAADPLVGTLLDGRYRVGPRIARGGMATVYEATDIRLDRPVAVKVLHGGYASDPDFTVRFQREARAAARLSHPNVVGVFDQGDDGGTVFLAMEYVAGRTLRDLIRAQAPLPPARALALLEPVLSALCAAHAAGFVHRDIKPENVLLGDDGTVKVADFGLARAVATSNQTAGTGGVLIGTVSYLPPEVVVDGAADARSDVYSCGVLLYELLTGHKPHRGESPIEVAYKHVHEDVPAPSLRQPGIPPYLDALVARATARQRDARFADAKVMLHQVRRVRLALDQGVYDDPELTADLTPTVPVPLDVPADPDEDTLHVVDTDGDPPPTHYEPARHRRRGWIALLVVLLVAAGAALAGWHYAVGRFTETPALVGLTLGQARDRLESTGLELSSRRGFSETVPVGEIISSDPGPGDRVLDQGTVTVVVSKGKERYDMPAVVGSAEDDAVAALGNNHLDAEVARRWSEEVAKGVVISSSEHAGTPLRRDTDVVLVVSKGRQPIDVPDLVGRTEAEARAVLRKVKLTAAVSQEFDASVPKGEVISQIPADGTLYAGDEVALLVSKGAPLVDVPSVFALDRDTAVETLEDAGFEVDVREADGYVGLNRVVSQSPGSLSEAPEGSTVTVYLY
jgi:serine/threonine-protein kinase